jgi:hypothetical protein
MALIRLRLFIVLFYLSAAKLSNSHETNKQIATFFDVKVAICNIFNLIDVGLSTNR